MQLKFDEQIPIYIQIMNSIKLDIVTKKISGGDKLPSVRELSERLKVNPNTTQRAYQELEREGITYTQRGTGSFVCEDQGMVKKLKMEMAEETIQNFIDGMTKLGYSAGEIVEIINKKISMEGK
jgi:GntR family transcriptional regulator